MSHAAVWTEARRRGYTPPNLARWMPAGPAELAGRKGAIAAGCDADLVVQDAEREFRLSAEGLHRRHTLTPFAGRRLAGVVEATHLRGVKVYDRATNSFPAGPAGRALRRGGEEFGAGGGPQPARRGSR